MSQQTGQHRPAKSKVKPHLFVADTDVPPDINGLGACRCGLIGEPGDRHHTLPAAPAQDVRGLAAGERERA